MRGRKKLFIKSTNNKVKTIHFRASPEEKAYLIQNASDTSLSLSEYLMGAAMGKRITSTIDCDIINQVRFLTMDLKALAVSTGMHLETGIHHETYNTLLRKLRDITLKSYERRGKFSS